MLQNLLIILFNSAIDFSKVSPGYCQASFHGSIFDNIAFCLGEKQSMLVNKECSSWYNRVADFWVSVWDRRKIKFMW